MDFPKIDIDRIAQDTAQATVAEMAQNYTPETAKSAGAGAPAGGQAAKVVSGPGKGAVVPTSHPLDAKESISLGQVIAAIHTSIAKGRSQADIATLQIAKMYRQDALLSTFPIPRVALAEITVDLKCAIAEAIPAETGLKGIKGKDLNVLVSAADLYHIPEEKVTTIRMKFDETDCIWNETTEGGKPSLKLVPS